MGKGKKRVRRKDKYVGRKPPRHYQKRQRSTSVYFLIWAIFATLSLFVVITLGISQQMLLERSYKDQARKDVSEAGKKIETAIHAGPPEWINDNYAGYLRYLAQTHNVRLAILNADGEVLFPKEVNFDPNAPEYEEMLDYSKEFATLYNKLQNKDVDFVVYQGDGEYVYGANLPLFGQTDAYLYVGRSMEFAEAVATKMLGRTVSVSFFIFIASFAVSSAVAGWIVKPIDAMTKKARRLAEGDFSVDFHGSDYGKEMVELADSLNFARDELSKTDRMQKELIANVSHDFKTPLTMIKGYASMIMEISGAIPEKRNKHAQIIVDEADRLASLVDDVLNLSKMQASLDVVKFREVNMSEYVEEIVSRFGYLQDSQGYELVVDIDGDLYAEVDERLIGQAVYNLIGNAVNYTGDDKKIFVSLKRVDDKKFRFQVRDTGAGIAPEEISAIWDRYYRAKETHKRPVKGTGLGLSIVKAIFQRHGLAFGAESEVGKGSTFFVVFPIAGIDEKNPKV
ncbi:MAG: HAMP domain-containing protein [Clostridia bacterium]|nr:HAMP domain-containing protein [Clostridia bacterium]